MDSIRLDDLDPGDMVILNNGVIHLVIGREIGKDPTRVTTYIVDTLRGPSVWSRSGSTTLLRIAIAGMLHADRRGA